MKIKSRDRVLMELQENFSPNWISTQELAKKLNLSREVVSLYLSQLYKENLVQKQSGRPVLWRAIDGHESDSFDNLIGFDGSQSGAIKKCKAAVNYPPHGLPLIITGPSGTGKSYLVNALYNYAQQQKVIDSNGTLITLNCADYANNPELLSSVLFGYKQGAFTGATEDKAGLIEKANNGIMFLDEVHRLTGEGQEKLFTLLDRGVYYPVGSDSDPHKVNVRFVFATTEPLNNFLLQTLQRRVPMNVELTALDERPIWEKYQLIIQSFSDESHRMHRDIYINPSIFRNLIQKNYPGNIGQLKNEIKILCAENYSNTSDEDLIIQKKSTNQNLILVGQRDQPLVPQTRFIQSTFQSVFDQLIQKLAEENDISVLAAFIYRMNENLQTNLFNWSNSNYLFSENRQSIQKLISNINTEFAVLKSDNAKLISSLSLLLTFINYIKFDKKTNVLNNLLSKLKKKYPRTSYMIDKHCHRLKVNLDCDQQIAFICFAIALIGEKIHNKVEAVPFTCVMIAHGSGVATNIRNIVNSLCSNFVFEAFDMPIDTGIDEISQEIQIYLKQLDVSSNNGVVLLFDMGSPQQLFAKINQATGSNLLVISNLTTSIALDVALRVLQKEQFEDLATHAETYNEAINIQFYEGLSQKNNIIISCMSGVGISEEIKKTILKSLDNSLEIITMEYSKLKNLLKYEDDTFFKNTMFVITTVDFPEKFSLPIINIYDILDGNGTNNFRSLLLKANFSSIEISSTIQNLIRFFSVEGVKHRLHILNPDVVITDVEQVVQNYEAFFDIHFSEKIKLNLYMHIALMLERMVLSGTNGEKLNQSLSNLTDNQQEFIKISKHIFEPIAMKYNLNVSLDEILLINEILAL